MKPVETWIYAVLLLVSVGLAWNAWKGEEVETRDKVVVFEPGGAAISAITWKAKTEEASLAVEGKGDDVRVWVTAGKRKKVEGPTPVPAPAVGDDDDSAAAAEPVPEPEPVYGEPELRSFPGNQQSKTLVKSLSPLEALRQFEGLDAERLTDMGLDDPKATLEITAGAKMLTLEVGDKAYGSSDTYVRAPGANTVYLVSSKVLGPLRGAESRLMDRNLFEFEATDVATAELVIGSRTARAVHEGRHDKDNAFWADPETPEEVDAGLDGLMKKVLQLRASSYLTDAEKPSAVEPALAVAFGGESKAMGRLELGRAVDAERSKEGEEPVYLWFARTGLTREGWVKVSPSSASDLVDSAEALLGS